MEEEFEEFEEHPQDDGTIPDYHATTTIDTNQWCSRFVKCKGCKLDAERMVKLPEEMALLGRWKDCR